MPHGAAQARATPAAPPQRRDRTAVADPGAAGADGAVSGGDVHGRGHELRCMVYGSTRAVPLAVLACTATAAPLLKVCFDTIALC